MAVGMLRTIVVDCLDPVPLAAFRSELLGVEIHHTEDDWISLRSAGDGHPRIAFQRVPEGKIAKNRLHLDVWVPDIEAATEAAVALGAIRLGVLVGESPEPFQVMADPAGNEFCLVHLEGSVGP